MNKKTLQLLASILCNLAGIATLCITPHWWQYIIGVTFITAGNIFTFTYAKER